MYAEGVQGKDPRKSGSRPDLIQPRSVKKKKENL